MAPLLAEHLEYVSDSARLQRFERALAGVIKPGARVADLGSGSGILSLLALRAGAAHVYAIDESDMIEVARETLSRCGMDGRVSFIAGRAQRVELPERVDAVMCDHVGGFGFDYGIVALLDDARRRFLKPGGAIVPRRLELHLAPVESARCHALGEGWSAPGVPAEFHWLRGLCINSEHLVDLEPGELLGAPARLGAIDLAAPAAQFLSWSAELAVERDGVLHGVGGWFDCELAEGVRMTNSPLAPDRIRRSQVFFPIEEALPVRAGQRLATTVMARPGDEVIAWSVESEGRRFAHSTWQSTPLSPRALRRADPARVPSPGREAAARAIILALCDGRRTACEVEDAVVRAHPALLPSETEIRRFVGRVLAQDTQA